MGVGKYKEDDLWFEDVYITLRSGESCTTPKSLGSPVNTAIHDAAVCVSSDGKSLFEARSVSVVQYLIDKEFDAKRIFAKGYGEAQPIDTNTPKEATNNRRTAYMILDLKDSTQEVYA